MAIDAQLNRQDAEAARKAGRIPTAFLPDDDMAGYGQLDSRRAMRHIALNDRLDAEFVTEEEEDLATEALMEADAAGYSLTEFVQMDIYRRRITRDFQRFLATFKTEQGQNVYLSKIRSMCASNHESLEISYMHLQRFNSFLAKLLANVPNEALKIFDEALMKVVLSQFEEYNSMKSEVHVRVGELPTIDNLRDLRHNHLNSLVRVSGVVTRRSGVYPQLKLVTFNCAKCGSLLGPFCQDLNEEIRIGSCSECSSKGPFNINAAQTVYRNYQKMTLQESPGSIPAGRLPRHKEVILLWDLIDSARPGEEIVILFNIRKLLESTETIFHMP